MRARHALSQDPKMISNAAGFPVPEKPFPVMSNSVPCYVQHLPCYGINREKQNIYLISGDKIRIFSGKSADNREEKNSFPVLSLFHAPEQGKHLAAITALVARQDRRKPRLRDRIGCGRGVVPRDGIQIENIIVTGQ